MEEESGGDVLANYALIGMAFQLFLMMLSWTALHSIGLRWPEREKMHCSIALFGW